MRHPLEGIPPHHRLQVLLGLVGLLLVVGKRMRGAQGSKPTARDLVDLEFAGTVRRADELLTPWDAGIRRRGIIRVRLDFIYLAAYVPAIALSCLWARDVFRLRAMRVAVMGTPLAWLQMIAGLADSVENVALLRMMQGPVTHPWPVLARWCASVKFSLVLAGLAYMAAGGLARLWIREAGAQPTSHFDGQRLDG